MYSYLYCNLVKSGADGYILIILFFVYANLLINFATVDSERRRIMSFKQIIEEIFTDRGPIIVVFIIMMSCIQVSPLKINPWSALVRWAGKHLNKGVVEKIDEVEGKVGEVNTKIDSVNDKVVALENQLNEHIEIADNKEIRRQRKSILDFASNLMRGLNYSQEHFEFIIAECDSYKQYCKDHDILNGVADISIAEIKRIYNDHYRSNTFLKEIHPAQQDSNTKKEV